MAITSQGFLKIRKLQDDSLLAKRTPLEKTLEKLVVYVKRSTILILGLCIVAYS